MKTEKTKSFDSSPMELLEKGYAPFWVLAGWCSEMLERFTDEQLRDIFVRTTTNHIDWVYPSSFGEDEENG